MKRTVLVFIIVLLLFFSIDAWCKQADLAGMWYSASPSALRAELQKFLKFAKVKEVKGEAIGFTSPHAGYRYSGPVAAYTYKAAALQDPDTVIVVGFSHKGLFPGISVFTDKEFVTPLGAALNDQDLARKLIACDDRIKNDPRMLKSEQSIEMQIPFIQVAMKDAKVVLVEMGYQDMGNILILADALYNVLKDEKNYVIIASTDMCHYLPYKEATVTDRKTIKVIERFNPELLFTTSMKEGHELMCGYGVTCAVMSACKKLGADDVQILKYANSGDTSGMKSRGVVGYLSAAFIKAEKGSRNNPVGEDRKEREEEEDMLNQDQRNVLLKIARDTINHYLRTGERLDVEVEDDLLKQDMGAFVTLHERGKLRGCIGHMVATGPLYLTVRDMAISAATDDPRFPRVKPEEMEDIDIEISVLSPMERIDDYEKIETGKHGVMVRMGFRSGVYLPQVATETGWDRDQFMTSLCASKAGIPPDAWKTGECDIYIFTAEVFGEKKHE